eukprot:jgi/Orpsp1_1/1190284/evm.model.d7180000077967.1
MERKYDRNNSFSKWDSSSVLKKRSKNSSVVSGSTKNIISTTNIYKKDDTSFDIVERLWKKINKKRKLNKDNKEKCSENDSYENIRDTTIDFLKNGNFNIKNNEKNILESNMYLFGSNFSHDSLNNNKEDNTTSFNKLNINALEGSYSNSKKLLGGLTFNDIYDENISKSLLKISEIFEANKEDIEDLISMQIAFNRSWKLFLIGLFQYESINRFFSMAAINFSIKYVNDTLLDKETLK